MDVIIGVSARHVHLKGEDFKILFGEQPFEKYKNLKQPGQFASTCCVMLKTEKAEIDGVRVIGPFRKYSQVEISRTDAYKLGLEPPIRSSGNIKDSSPITLVGPKGILYLKEGCIIADRHIHMLPKQAQMYGLEDRKEVAVTLPGEKGGILFHVKLRISEDAYFEMHLDTDDANAHMIKNGMLAHIIDNDR